MPNGFSLENSASEILWTACLGDANNLQGLQNLNLAALAAFAANSPGMC